MVDVMGTRLGRYEIRERIGKGGMSIVYKAWDTTLDRWVAVKVLHDYLSDEKDFRARFEREAKIVAGLNHPNIVQVYDFAANERTEATTYYMVLQYIEGESLRLRMEAFHVADQRMPLNAISKIMRGVCGALAYAHAHGMVHRDVTPGNILFNADGDVVLADFGIARMVSGTRLTQSGTTSGTPVYMSPEQGIGEPGDNRSDVSSLGVILFEMLTGQAPYEGDSAFAVLMKHVNDPVPSLLDKNPALPPALEGVVTRALAKEPGDRYQKVEEFLQDFESALVGKATIAAIGQTAQRKNNKTLADATTRINLPKGRRAWIVLLVGILAILPLIAVIIGAAQHGSTGAPGAALPLNVPALATRRFAPSMTSGPLDFVDPFDGPVAKWTWPTGTMTLDEGEVTRSMEDGQYRIRHSLKSTAVTTLFDEHYQYADSYSYEADLAISEQSQRDAAAGIVFRFRNDDQYYVFAVDGQGQVSIWRRYRGEWLELRRLEQNQDWTPAAGVNPAGQVNHVKVIDNRDRLIGMVNGKTVVDVKIEEIWYSGGIGVYLATTRTDVPNPIAEVAVDNFGAQAYKAPTATPGS